MNKALALLVVSLGLGDTAAAGVVFEIEIVSPGQDVAEPDRLSTAVAGKNIKMNVSGPRGADSDLVYRGDRREMIAIDHEGQRYFTINEATIDEISARLADTDAQVEALLQTVEPEQRPQMEPLIRQEIEQAKASAPAPPVIEIRNTGDKANQHGYPCVRHELYRDGALSKVYWVTDWDNIDGGPAAKAAFEDMAAFIKELQAGLPDYAQSPDTGNNAYENLDELGGFPVVTLEYGRDGVLMTESRLASSREQDIDPAAFDPPAGYVRQVQPQ